MESKNSKVKAMNLSNKANISREGKSNFCTPPSSKKRRGPNKRSRESYEFIKKNLNGYLLNL